MTGQPKWSTPTLGPTTLDSVLERRSLIWNDNDIEDDTTPDAFYEAETYKGKFFTRGCRGMIEAIQLYCIGDAADEITLRYSPYPCFGPFGEVTITPAAAWAWQAFVIEEMWNYDSLFIWVYKCEANVDWAYDIVESFDGHESDDAGVTWEDIAIRPFIRAVYTGETPGDVPISGTINSIPIPSMSADMISDTNVTPFGGGEVVLDTLPGAGYCDLIMVAVGAVAGSHQARLRVYCDGQLAFNLDFLSLNAIGVTASTPGVSLTTYAVNGDCAMVVTKKLEFRRRFKIVGYHATSVVAFSVQALPTLMR